jgi:hypothetical protein
VELVTVGLRKMNSLKLQKRGQFPDEPARIKNAQIHPGLLVIGESVDEHEEEPEV